MADLTFASHLQGPLGEAIQATDDLGLLPSPTLAPAVTLSGGSIAPPASVPGPPMRMLGPGDVASLAGGTVVRTDPPAGAVDVEPNYMAVAEVVPAELPWLLTPAKAAAGRLRPWFVLVVLEAAKIPLQPGTPLPTIEAPVAELPDLRDSWGWAHVQRTTGSDALPGGGQAAAASVARLLCPRRLSSDITYRACLVPAFSSGRAAGLGDPRASEAPNDLAWKVEGGGSVHLPVYHHWTFTTGASGDFEELVTRLRPADPEALRVSSARPVDMRAPWPGDEPLAPDAQLVGVQGALVPFADPPIPEPQVSAETLATFDERIRAELAAPELRVQEAPEEGTTGTLAPPLYGGRHVLHNLVEANPPWLTALNASVANRVAAGLGTNYVRDNQEDLMAKAWAQVGAIREANRLRAVVELTTEVADKVHARHFARLAPGEMLAVAAPASVRTKTSDTTTLAMETRMSRMVDGTASTAFARRIRPAGKLAKQTGISLQTMIPRALAGDVTVPAGAPVLGPSVTVVDAGLTDVSSHATATQLVMMTAMVQVAALNDAGADGDLLTARIDSLQLGGDLTASMGIGSISFLASAIADQVGTVSAVTSSVLTDMRTDAAQFGAVSEFGVPIDDAAIAGRITAALQPGGSHRERLASQVLLPGHVTVAGPSDPIMACPAFPLPTALTLLKSDPEWFMAGLGALPANRVALLSQNGEFIESYLTGMNHELMRELLWREYPTDQRGTAFTRFWPRPDGAPDIPPIVTWTDHIPLGKRLTQADSLSVLLVRGDVVRRYPGMVVTAVPAARPEDDANRFRPDPAQTPLAPMFVIEVDEATTAYAFEIDNAALMTPASRDAPGWFFVFAEHGFRIRFGFDEPPDPDEPPGLDGPLVFDSWDKAAWPPSDGRTHPAFAQVERGHAIAGAGFDSPPSDAPSWKRDSADIARITLQRPFRVAIQADILLHPKVEG